MDHTAKAINDFLKEEFGSRYDEVMEEHPNLFRYHYDTYCEPFSISDCRYHSVISLIIKHIHSQYLPLKPFKRFPQVVFMLSDGEAEIYIDDIITNNQDDFFIPAHELLEAVGKADNTETAIANLLNERIMSDIELRYLNAVMITDYKDRTSLWGGKSGQQRREHEYELSLALGNIFASCEIITYREAFKRWLAKSCIHEKNNRHRIRFLWLEHDFGIWTEKGEYRIEKYMGGERTPQFDYNDPKCTVALTSEDICRGLMTIPSYQQMEYDVYEEL